MDRCRFAELFRSSELVPTAGRCRGLYAHLGVFKYQAGFWRDFQPCGGQQKRFGIGFAFLVVPCADEGVKSIEKIELRERRGDGVEVATRYNRKRNLAMPGFDVLQDFGNSLKLRKQFEIETLLSVCDLFHWHIQPALPI